MNRLRLLYGSTVGKKAIVAVTGAAMLLFLILHVVGNLKAFLPDASPGVPDIDSYSEFLRSAGEPILPHSFALLLVRATLLVAVGLHIVCVFQLAIINRRARPTHYDRLDLVEAGASGRWMLYTGTLLLVFIVIHLLHFTTGTLDAARFSAGEVYGNLYRAFGQWYYAVFYLAAMCILALHLYHGGWSLFQSLGLDNPDRNRGLRRLAVVLAVGLALGFASVPVAFFAGFMDAPPETQRSAALEEGR